MESITIKNFNEYIERIDSIKSHKATYIYRGQQKKGYLLPNIARDNPSNNTTKIEKDTLEEFKRLGSNFLSDNNDNEWDLLVKAQHYGLSTRLLDWTSNPLCALWFACESEIDKNGYVYVLNSDGLISKAARGPFANGKTRVFKPRLNNNRIVAQHGWFTAHIYSRKHKKFVRLENNSEIKHSMAEIIIPKHIRAEIKQSLDSFGINQRTLFPDIEGLCKYMNWQQKLLLTTTF